jgi:methanogenic corrinoid protein MtbC1
VSFDELRERVAGALIRKDRAACVEAAVGALAAGEVDVPTLYQEVLAPALNEADYGPGPSEVRIWQEHIRSAIVRTVVENCATFVARERAARGRAGGPPVVVYCPPEELHEIGARMVADFFEIAGFEVAFVGANTPRSEATAAIRLVRPALVAVSVSTTYALTLAKRSVADLRALREREGLSFRIVVGGHAFANNPQVGRAMGADLLLATFEDIARLREEA